MPGECHEGECHCEERYAGEFCEQSTACDGIVDSEGLCCMTPLRSNGTCCPGNLSNITYVDELDICCREEDKDALGRCYGEIPFVDVTGRPCNSTELDANSLCCDGVVDECGICDGINSCKLTVKLILRIPPYYEFRNVEEWSFTVR